MRQLSLVTAESDVQSQREHLRVNALRAYDILDSAPEPAFDAITRLAAERFDADYAVISFVDETRSWTKSHWGNFVRELPRSSSIFDLVVAGNQPIEFCDLPRIPGFLEARPQLRQLGIVQLAASPVRSAQGQMLGILLIMRKTPAPVLKPEELQILESMTNMVTSELELRKLRSDSSHGRLRKVSKANVGDVCAWPRGSDLRHALERREFVMHYQPEIDLQTRKIVGVEALIRWQHPDRGMVPPIAFIPHAEDSGMILPIGDWVLSEACRQIERWNRQDSRNGSLRVYVNLSARQFSREGLADHIQLLLMQAGADSRQLGLEMTETSLILNMDSALNGLQGLRALGVSLLMDDFGTGYSSLNHLHSFPFDVLKIDRSFIARMTEGDQALQIVRTIIELARVMRMDVVAEGIETQEQYRLLRQLGCRYGQGFYFAPPMPETEVTMLLNLPGRILPEGTTATSNALPRMFAPHVAVGASATSGHADMD